MSVPYPARRLASACALAAILAPFLHAGVQPEPLIAFDEPFAFAYGSWLNRAKTVGGVATIEGGDLTDAGGAGVFSERDLVPFSAFSPAVRVKVGPGNQAGSLRLLLMDASRRTARWSFPLSGLKPEDGFVVLTPKDGAALAEPNEIEGGATIDLSAIKQIQIQGDWGGKPMAIEVDEVVLVPETPGLSAQRAAFRKRVEEEKEAARKAKEAARAGIRHTPNSPWIVHVGAVSECILGITIQSGSVRKFDLQPYEAQEGDLIEQGEGRYPVVENGKITEGAGERILVREVGGKTQKIGYVVGGADGRLFLSPAEQLEGDPLETLTVDDPASYEIRSDDPGLRGPVHPVKVSRKSHVTDRAQIPEGQPNGGRAVRHTVYLHLPKPLEEGKRYTIRFPGVNTRDEETLYVHDSRRSRSEAIHASQIGYRPDDPYKRAFVSIWLGNGGGYQPEGIAFFELLDASGETAFTGTAALVLPLDGTEKMRTEKNYSATAVHALDFSAFRESGTFQVHVPGLGVSHPVVIGETVWQNAFCTAMHGFLSQRASVELGPPLTPYRKPLNFHPGVGTKVYWSTITVQEAEAAEGDWFEPLAAARTDEEVPDAWGGYMDAGDYDRVYNHMWASYLHLELLEMFPDFFGGLKLAIPGEEATNAIPDILDEALWNIDFYRRLQRKDGGVTGGVESSSHPRHGEPSWLDSLVTMAYAPDPMASFTLAACGAKTARLLEKYDAARAALFAESARRAWDWAEREKGAFIARLGGGAANGVAHVRALAAVELLWLTANDAYAEAFKESSVLNGVQEGGTTDQAAALFTYARLPRGLGDDEWKAMAKNRIVRDAEVAVEFGKGNVFGITTSVPSLPEIGWVGYFTTPEMIQPLLPRAHYLTGDVRYLEAAVRATNFTAGANPQNMTFTTGLGYAFPRNPLQIDHRHSNQEAPAGLTLYGATDPALQEGACTWAYIWVLGEWQTPGAFAWPATEAFCDIYMWPAMTEYTIRQTMGPTGYYWGYLSARDALR